LPAAGLLEIEQVVVVDQAGKLHGFIRRVALVRVGDQDEVVARSFTGFDKALGIDFRTTAAHLELHAGDFRLARRFHLFGDGHIVVVVAAGPDHLDAVAIASPELPQRQAQGFANGVPNRSIYTSTGHQADATVAQNVPGGGTGALPAALDGIGIFAD